MVSGLAPLGSALAPWHTLEFEAGCTIIVVENSDYSEVDREAPVVDSTFWHKLTRHLLLCRLCLVCRHYIYRRLRLSIASKLEGSRLVLFKAIFAAFLLII